MESPSHTEIQSARARAGLTLREAAALVHVTLNCQQKWEHGSRRMPPGLWELFRIKTGQP
jgi:DNA-binding transcriptional regulator YiaG